MKSDSYKIVEMDSSILEKDEKVEDSEEKEVQPENLGSISEKDVAGEATAKLNEMIEIEI
jgi:DNA-directed RNA polymerase subunit H (RpoH/RPB5)